MDNKVVDQAMLFVRKLKEKNGDSVPDWAKYEALVNAHLKDAFNVKSKVPNEYYYAYLRGKGNSHTEALERMGLDSKGTKKAPEKKGFFSF